LPRDLSDVLHYFMPELDRPDETPPLRPPEATAPSTAETGGEAGCLPLASVPVGDSDLLRAGLVRSLAEEVGQLGGRTILVTPETKNARGLFADAVGLRGNAGSAEIEVVAAHSLHELASRAIERASELKAAADVDGVVIARIPPAWLEGALLPSELFEWLLLFTSPHERNLSDAYALASRVLAENPEAEIGVAVHGAAGRTEGEAAFGLLARSVEQRMGRSLVSYGMLVDDLDVYRSLAARQALGCAHPDSPARAALHEAAKRVFERARKAAFH